MRIVLSTAVVLVLAAPAARAQAPAALPANDVAAIRAASAASTAAAGRKDLAAWFAVLADDVVMMPANAPMIAGRAAAEAYLRGFPPFKDLRVEPLEIEGRGDLAYVRGRYSIVVGPPGGPEQRDAGKYIEIWRKQADGTWKITHDISTSDLPAAAPAPARQP
jgi:ketosteroid isomerase-like protein